MDARVKARRLLEIDLRQAIAGGGFELHYQPLVDVPTAPSAAAKRWCDGAIPSAA